MRHIILFAAFAVLVSAGAAPAQTYSCLLDNRIAVADLAGGAPRRLAEGADPAISPDGTQIAYTQSDEEGNRRIAILDVATGQSRLVEGIEGKNEFMPAWSADGRKLLFGHFTGADWALAAVNAEGGGFQIVIDPGTRKAAGYSALPGGTDWLCHDLEGFYTVRLSADGPGTIRELAKAGRIEGLSMPSRLAVSPDGKTALFSRFVDGDGSTEPPSAVYLLDLATGETTRMTPPGVLADGPAWLPGGQEFLFASFDPKTETPSIYRTSIKPGTKPVLVKAKASNPSASAVPVVTEQTVTYVKCILHTGSARLVFRDADGNEIEASVMTKAQRTGMDPDEFYVKFPEAMIDPQAKDQSDTNAAMVGKKFILRKNEDGDIIEIKAVR
jgi:TolB protein